MCRVRTRGCWARADRRGRGRAAGVGVAVSQADANNVVIASSCATVGAGVVVDVVFPERCEALLVVVELGRREGHRVVLSALLA